MRRGPLSVRGITSNRLRGRYVSRRHDADASPCGNAQTRGRFAPRARARARGSSAAARARAPRSAARTRVVDAARVRADESPKETRGLTAPDDAPRPDLFFAEGPHEEEDPDAGEQRDEKRRPTRNADREHSEPEKQEEDDRPDKALHTVINRRRPKVHRCSSLHRTPEKQRGSAARQSRAFSGRYVLGAASPRRRNAWGVADPSKRTNRARARNAPAGPPSREVRSTSSEKIEGARGPLRFHRVGFAFVHSSD